MKKDCGKNKILNPKTNRCVSINGKIGKNILASTKKETILKTKDCDKYKILNPKTNRCVSIDGKIGKNILALMKETKKEPKKETKKETKKEPKREPKKEPKRETKRETKKETKPKYKLNIKFPMNHSLNQKQIDKYINACDLETRPILRKIFDNTVHVSFETFIMNLNKNIKDLINFVGNTNKIYFYINEEFKTKSNYWIYIYIKDYCNFYYPKLILELINDFPNVNNNDCVVFVDDCIYSGYQMTSNIYQLANVKTMISLNIFLLCPYISTHGLNRINKEFKYVADKYNTNLKLYINKFVNIIPLIDDYLTKKEIEIINKYTRINMSSVTEKYLIYFDHKLADTVSTITHIYSGYVLDKYNNDIYTKMYSYGEVPQHYYNKLHIIPIINNCENIKNYYLFTPECPYTPYKITFDNLIKAFKSKKYLSI